MNAQEVVVARPARVPGSVLAMDVSRCVVEVAGGEVAVVWAPFEDPERSGGSIDFAVGQEGDVGEDAEDAVAGVFAGPLHFAAGDDDGGAAGFGAFGFEPEGAAVFGGCGVVGVAVPDVVDVQPRSR